MSAIRVSPVTILYYEQENPVTVLKDVVDATFNDEGRAQLSQKDREGRLIICVLDGEVTVLSSMGQRWGDYTAEPQLQIDDEEYSLEIN